MKNSKISIAFIWSNIERTIGGAEYFLIDLLKYMKSYPSLSATVYYADYGINLIKYINDHDIVVLYSLNSVLKILPFIKIPAVIDIHSPDWLWYFREKTYRTPVSTLTRLKRIWVKFFGKRFYCRTLNYFDYKTMKNICRDGFLIPNFVDTSFFRPSSSKDEEFAVIVRHDLSFKGGFDVFLRAIKVLGRSPWLNVVLIGGEPPQRIIKYLNNYVNVIPLGRVKRDRLPRIYSRAHFVAIPSRLESFSLTALEALASGTPIIMSDLPPTLWFLRDMSIRSPGTGIRFKPGDPVDLALKIKFAYELWNRNNDIYLKSVLMSRETAEKFDINNVIPKYIKMLYIVLNNDSKDNIGEASSRCI